MYFYTSILSVIHTTYILWGQIYSNTLKNKITLKGVYTITKETLTFSIDKDLKLELKILALRQETTVTEILNDMIVEYIEKNK